MADGYISQITLPDNNSYQLKDKTVDKIYYGTCSTVAGTAQKDVVVANADFTNDNLIQGTILFVTFTATNSAAVANLTLKVGSADAKPLKRMYNASATENIPDKGYLLANQTYPFYYNGTNWVVWMQYNTNTTYSYMRPYENTGKGSYSSQNLNPSKTAAAGWKYQLTAGKYFMYTHYYDNQAQSALTLNIGSTGAKPIYINGAPSSSTNYTLPGGQYLVYYDGTNYHFRTDDKIPGNIAGDAATVNGLTVQTAVPQNAVFTDHYDWEDITNKPSTATSWPAWNQIRQTGANSLNQGSSDVTASTEILTSYASNNGFSDSNGQGVVYRRAASKVVNATLVKAALGTNSTHNNNFLRKDGSWSTIQSASTSTAGIVQLYDGIDSTSTTLAATANAVKTAYDTATGIVAAADAMIFKGTLNGATNTTYTPAADRGWTYKVAAAGKINGEQVEIGDILICTTDSTAAATADNVSTVKANWVIVQNNVDGAVFKGSNAFVNNEIITADQTSGKVKSSGKSFSTTTPTSSSTDAQIPTAKAVWAAIDALDYLPLSGGTMTGNINRYYSVDSTEPMITMLSNNKDIYLWEAGHGTEAATTTTSNHYKLLYKGTGSDDSNSKYLQLIAHKTSDLIAVQIDEIGNVSLPQMNKGSATKPIYLNNGIITEGNDIGASGYHADSYFVKAVTSTDNAIVRFNSTAGQVQDSGATIDDNGCITIPHTANKSGELKITYGTTISMWFGVGTANQNHGIYDDKANKWILSAGTANTWTFDGNAATATSWTNARKVYVALGTASTTTTINGGASNAAAIGIGVDGTLAIANGGTGKTSAQDAANALISGLPTWTAAPTDDTYLIRKNTDGSATFGQVKFSTVWTYIKGKADSIYSASGHDHSGIYVPNTSGVNDINTLYNTGIYNITTGSLTNGPVGYGYGQLLVMSYRKHTGNTSTDWAMQLYSHLGSGNNGNTLYYRTSNATTWQTWQMAAHSNAGIAVGDSATPIYITSRGEITACTDCQAIEIIRL